MDLSERKNLDGQLQPLSMYGHWQKLGCIYIDFLFFAMTLYPFIVEFYNKTLNVTIEQRNRMIMMILAIMSAVDSD